MTSPAAGEGGVIAGPIEFGIHQPMHSATGEAVREKYWMAAGKDGRRWLWADAPNAADQVWVDGGKGSEGCGGRTVIFELFGGSKVWFVGPWKTSADGLFAATGVDIRDKYTSRGIVCFEKENAQKFGQPDICRQIAHYDAEPVIGSFDRIENIAQRVANESGRTVWMAVTTQGGGHSKWLKPEPELAKQP